MAAAALVDAAFEQGDAVPLRGLTVAVKDNIDVAGLPTTAACPSFAFEPTASAPSVVALERAGAVVIGKTNMDQFATGLVGTRSPYGAVTSVVAPGHIGGGSSSGSAAAVALGLVDLALGTDTAGSGRVPAACQGIVGIKPTFGLVSVDGVLPACRSFDCVSVFARSVELASRRWDVLAETSTRPSPTVGPLRPVTTIGVPVDGLGPLDPAFRTLFDATVAEARRQGFEIVEVPFDLFSQAGALLYGGAFVSERHAAVGAFIDAHPDDVDPSVRTIIQSGAAIPAVDLVADQERLDHLKRRTRDLFATIDAVLVPTIPWHPTLDEVAADPIGANSRVGIYSFACNLLDLCAVAVPVATTADGIPFGVTLMGPAGTDAATATAAARLLGEPTTETVTETLADGDIRLVVAGAHLTGQPLNHELTDRGGRLVGHHDHRSHLPPARAGHRPAEARPGEGGGRSRSTADRGRGVVAAARRVRPLRRRRPPTAGHRPGRAGRRLLDSRLHLHAVRPRRRHRHHGLRRLARLPRRHDELAGLSAGSRRRAPPERTHRASEGADVT